MLISHQKEICFISRGCITTLAWVAINSLTRETQELTKRDSSYLKQVVLPALQSSRKVPSTLKEANSPEPRIRQESWIQNQTVTSPLRCHLSLMHKLSRQLLSAWDLPFTFFALQGLIRKDSIFLNCWLLRVFTRFWGCRE